MQEFGEKYELCTLKEIKKWDIQLLISHSKEINRKFTPSSKLITFILMIIKDKVDQMTSPLICLSSRDSQYPID